MLHESDVKRVLSKFETADFIHTYIPCAAALAAPSCPVILFELPRYSLEFELQQEQLVSLDHRGYCLSKQQQLVTASCSTGTSTRTSGKPLYTFPDFQQYLLLERIPSSAVVVGAKRADSLVLIAVGDVKCIRGALGSARPSVSVQVSCSSRASLKVCGVIK